MSNEQTDGTSQPPEGGAKTEQEKERTLPKDILKGLSWISVTVSAITGIMSLVALYARSRPAIVLWSAGVLAIALVGVVITRRATGRTIGVPQLAAISGIIVLVAAAIGGILVYTRTIASTTASATPSPSVIHRNVETPTLPLTPSPDASHFSSVASSSLTPLVGASAQINSPYHLERVPVICTAQGVVHNIPRGSSAWLVVKYGPYYWPEIALPAGISDWKQIVIIGSPAYSGQVFTLLVVQADPVADQEFNAWRAATNGRAQPQGLTEGSDYPATHVRTLSAVDVVLQ